MIDKLITLDDGTSLSILEKVKYNGKLFILAIEVDKEKEEITNKLLLSEIKITDGTKIVLKDFESVEEKELVSKLFMKKLEENAKNA